MEMSSEIPELLREERRTEINEVTKRHILVTFFL